MMVVKDNDEVPSNEITEIESKVEKSKTGIGRQSNGQPLVINPQKYINQIKRISHTIKIQAHKKLIINTTSIMSANELTKIAEVRPYYHHGTTQ
ncbi:unnamed protein product [Macrosiphum euphorbiae]|uniref:Uncharacterized protein n=1 Tax=Macrosiphum euphorbiae TaxID=13131 RepID=A0AAV0X7I4_9HEMI|nr:unnamed protein product [Macrosiphum euphorbiae]